jgi:hypothetical protein
MNLTTLLSGSNVGKTVDLLLKDPLWIDELVDVKFNPQKVRCRFEIIDNKVVRFIGLSKINE